MTQANTNTASLPKGPKPRGATLSRKLLRFVLFLFTFLVISLAIIVGIGRAYLDAHPEVKDELANNLSERLGITLATDDIGVRMRWSGPQITVDNLQILHPQNKKKIISFDEVQVVLDVPRYLKTRVLGVSTVRLQGVDLFLQKRNSTDWYFNGLAFTELNRLVSNNTDQQNDLPSEFTSDFRIPKGNFEIDGVNFIFQDLVSQQDLRISNAKTTVDSNDQQIKVNLAAGIENITDDIKLAVSTQNPELHEKLDWQILFESENINLAQLNSELEKITTVFLKSTNVQSFKDTVTLSQGESAVKLWARISDDSIQALNGKLELKDLKLTENLGSAEKVLNDLSMRFSLERDGALTSFKIDNIDVADPLGKWPKKNQLHFKLLEYSQAGEYLATTPIQRELTVNQDALETEILETVPESENITDLTTEENGTDKQFKLAELKLDYINFDNLGPVVKIFTSIVPQSEAFPKVNWSQLSGELSNVHFMLSSPSKNAPGLMHIDNAQARFNRLSIPSINDSYNFSGLSGALDFSNTKGQLNLNSNKLVFKNLKVFRQSLAFDALKAKLIIERDGQNWNLSSDNFELDNSDFNLATKFDLSLVENKSPVLDLSGELDPKTLRNIKQYYPAKIMDPKLLKWLDNSVSGGDIDKAKIVFKGALADYPFREKQGEFLTQFDLKDLDLTYAENWPAVRLQEAEIILANESLLIDVKKAQTGELENVPMRGEFKDLASSVLDLSFNSVLDLQKTKEWINSSPLRENIGKSLTGIDIFGTAYSDLKLMLPLKDTDTLTLQGSIQFDNNLLRLSAFDDPFTNLNGLLNFNEKYIQSDELKTTYLEQLINAKLEPLGQSTLITLNTSAQLGPFLGKQYSKFINGSSIVNAEVIVGGENVEGVQSIKLSSNLLGTGLVLPAPFAKDQDTLMPLNLDINVVKFAQGDQKEQLRLAGSIGNSLIQARFDSLLNNSKSDWALLSMSLVGGDNVKLFEGLNPEIARINVLGNYSHVDFDEWLDFITDDNNSATNDELEIGIIDVNLKKLEAIGQSFEDIKVTLKPNANSWQAKVNNDIVDGAITIPRPWREDSLIQANLESYKLILPEDDQTDEIEFDPREIPNVEVKVKNFSLLDFPFGETSLRIQREKNGARIDDFSVNNSAFSILGSGGWYRTIEGETSLVSIELNSNDLVKTLNQLGYAPVASASQANSLIELNWPGSPFDDILQNVSGSVSFKLLNGDIRDVEPGAGRFLALLSIAQLPKRLSLDFRDVFNAGLKYDELSADFAIQQGQAYTNNMLMRGPVADLGVVGRVGLATRDFEQAAVVQADLGSTLPVAGALAGGLGVGAAMLIFSEIFKNPLKKATQVFYKIDGKWNDPKIVRTLARNLEEIPVAPR